jgi:hypothetical protein
LERGESLGGKPGPTVSLEDLDRRGFHDWPSGVPARSIVYGAVALLPTVTYPWWLSAFAISS